ncbi:MAG: hypothetical protein A2103_04455 [Gammaproteobacteria bacterium GWF2_41_13]|nr:MAG: hypothetical protein A2103_04455 [Gammaproteobacteria bacterium GWF2_41_13]
MTILFEKNGIQLTELCWADIRQAVKTVNPELFEVLEIIEPKSNEKLIKVTYPFASSITNDGDFYLPNLSGKLVPLALSDLSNNIKKSLDYIPIPLGLLLNKGCEVFVHVNNKTTTLNILQPGKLFGLFEITDLLSDISIRPPWCVAAGAQSIFMLPKISDAIGHKKLKQKFSSLPTTPPLCFEDHAHLFELIDKNTPQSAPWHCEVLYFTRPWFESFKTKKRLAPFYHYLFKARHRQGIHALSESAIHLTWQNILLTLGKRNIKPRPYLLDTLRRLLHLIIGTVPGFVVADHSETFAPTKLVQTEYLNTYGLKKYLPTLMHPEKLLATPKIKTIYYSLACPLLQESIPDYKNPTPLIDDLRTLKFMLDTIQEALYAKRLTIPDISKNLYHVRLDYFHTNKDIYNEIQNAAILPSLDPTFENDKNLYKDRVFCSTSSFLNGVIKITFPA